MAHYVDLWGFIQNKKKKIFSKKTKKNKQNYQALSLRYCGGEQENVGGFGVVDSTGQQGGLKHFKLLLLLL